MLDSIGPRGIRLRGQQGLPCNAGAQVQSLVRELDPACHNHKILRATTEIQLAK